MFRVWLFFFLQTPGAKTCTALKQRPATGRSLPALRKEKRKLHLLFRLTTKQAPIGYICSFSGIIEMHHGDPPVFGTREKSLNIYA